MSTLNTELAKLTFISRDLGSSLVLGWVTSTRGLAVCTRAGMSASTAISCSNSGLRRDHIIRICYYRTTILSLTEF